MTELKNTFLLLRFHFSFFLLPVFLFGLSQVPDINWADAFLLLIVLHLLVYPASNGYNSYIDKDTTPIGGLERPPQPGKSLFWITVVMDVLALLITFALINLITGLFVLIYILASRAYSSRLIRLKKYPVTGFLTVFIFQGAWIFLAVIKSQDYSPDSALIYRSLIASLLIGAMYPLTQIYQHEADRKDSVTTLSMKLGIRGTFYFSIVLYLISIFLLMTYCSSDEFIVFMIINLPVVVFFLWWAYKCHMKPNAANFRNAYTMNIISGACNVMCFLGFIYINHFA